MSQFIYDVNGYVCDFVSNEDWHNFAAWARTQGGNLELLVDDGYCPNVKDLMAEAKESRCDNADDEVVRKNLVEHAARCYELLIVSDGPIDGHRDEIRRVFPKRAPRTLPKGPPIQWWGFHHEYGWVVLDRAPHCNRPGKRGILKFVRCSDSVPYDEPWERWKPPRYIYWEAHLQSLSAASRSLGQKELATHRANYWQTHRQSLEKEMAQRHQSNERQERLAISLQQFSISIMDARVNATAVWPSLDRQDIALCIAWSGNNCRRPPTHTDAALLVESIGKYEAGRLLSARAAELAAIAYYRNLGKQVTDVSIGQIESNDDRWKDYDLLVDGRPVDVKNARQSFTSSDHYVSHCIPRFKLTRECGTEVTVVGILSPYLEVQDILEGNREVQVLGEVTISGIRLLYRWMQKRFGSFLNLEALWKPDYQPGWAFEYSAEHYIKRLHAIDNLRQVLVQGRYAIEEVPSWIFPLFAQTDLPMSNGHSGEKKRILTDLRSIADQIGLSRPTLFVYAIGVLLESMLHGVPAQQIVLPLRALLFDPSNRSSPLWLLDTQGYVEELIDMLLKVHEEVMRQHITFIAFRLPHPSILRGQRDDGSWLTLLAYCGGWRSVPIRRPCGASPLSFGNHAVCSSCSYLVCNACGYCSRNCELVSGRQREVADKHLAEGVPLEQRHRERATLRTGRMEQDFDDDIPF